MFTCFICILSALLIEGRDTTSIFQYRSFLVNLISTAPFTSTAAAATATFSTITQCTDALDFASDVLLPLAYSNASNPSSLLSQGITLVWPLQLVNKLVARSSSCPSVDGSSTTSCFPSWDNSASAEVEDVYLLQKLNAPSSVVSTNTNVPYTHALLSDKEQPHRIMALVCFVFSVPRVHGARGHHGRQIRSQQSVRQRRLQAVAHRHRPPFVLCSKLQTLTAASGSYSAALSSLRLAAQSQWISQQHTRAVFMTFGLFVPSTNYFFVATLLVECFSTVSERLLAVAPRFSAMSRVVCRRPPTCDL